MTFLVANAAEWEADGMHRTRHFYASCVVVWGSSEPRRASLFFLVAVVAAPVPSPEVRNELLDFRLVSFVDMDRVVMTSAVLLQVSFCPCTAHAQTDLLTNSCQDGAKRALSAFPFELSGSP